MCSKSISVWFMCKTCRASYNTTEDFVEHKKEDHFDEFQKITCIVFEEREAYSYENSLSSPLSTHEEHQLPTTSTSDSSQIERDRDQTSPRGSPIDPGTGQTSSSKCFKIEPNCVDQTLPSSPLPVDQGEGQSPKYIKIEVDGDGYDYDYDEDAVSSSGSPKATELNSHSHSSFIPSSQGFIIKPNSIDNSLTYNRVQEPNSSELIIFESESPGPETESHSPHPHTSQNSIPIITITTTDPPDSSFQCKLCSENFNAPSELKIHTAVCALHHPDRESYCVQCNRKFSRPKKLRSHFLSFHSAEGDKSMFYKYKCHLCPMKYGRKEEFLNHLEYHRSESDMHSDFYCVPCNQHFSNRQTLEEHGLRFHSAVTVTIVNEEPIPTFKCQLCPINFWDEASLKNHVVESHKVVDERPYKCDLCGRSYFRKDCLTTHLKLHSDERPHKCPEENCSKAYKQSSHLRDHMQAAHSGSNPFKCPKSNCGKSFKRRSLLYKHEATHSDLRPFKCPHHNCDKAFKYQCYFSDHLKSHTGELPFKCTVGHCNKVFSTSSWLYSHRKIVHGLK